MDGISFFSSNKKLGQNLKVIDNVISDKHVQSFNKNEYIPNKSPLTNIVIYDVETFTTIKCVLYSNCIYKLSKISGKNYRDITEQEYEKSLNDCVVFKGLDSTNQMLDHVLSFKGEPRNSKKDC